MTEGGSIAVDEIIVDRHSDRGTHAERQYHPNNRDESGIPPVLLHDLRVDLDSDKKEEENEADVCDQVEVGHRGLGKDGVGEIWDMPHDGWTQHDATNDFGDDFRLSEEGEDVAEALGEAEDDDELDDKDGNGLTSQRAAAYL